MVVARIVETTLQAIWLDHRKLPKKCDPGYSSDIFTDEDVIQSHEGLDVRTGAAQILALKLRVHMHRLSLQVLSHRRHRVVGH